MAKGRSLLIPFWISAIDRKRHSPNGPSEEFLKGRFAVDAAHRGPSFYSIFYHIARKSYE